MGNDTMKEEYPDSKQRQAVCQQKWKDKDKKSSGYSRTPIEMNAEGGFLIPKEASDAICQAREAAIFPPDPPSVRYTVPAGSVRVDKIVLPDERHDNEIERRCFAESELRIDSEGDDAQPVIRGHAALFNKLSDELTGFDDTGRLRRFREQILPGAFKRSLAKQVDVKALIGHETELQTIGRTTNGTLELEEDGKGLAVKIAPPDTQPGRDVTALVRRGDLNQMSFAFKIRKGGESWEEDEAGKAIRTVSDLDLFDVSIVSFPAYPQTKVAVRSLTAWRAEQDKAAQNQREINKRRIDSRA